MFDALKRWRRRRVLGRSALPDGLCVEVIQASGGSVAAALAVDPRT